MEVPLKSTANFTPKWNIYNKYCGADCYLSTGKAWQLSMICWISAPAPTRRGDRRHVHCNARIPVRPLGMLVLGRDPAGAALTMAQRSMSAWWTLSGSVSKPLPSYGGYRCMGFTYPRRLYPFLEGMKDVIAIGSLALAAEYYPSLSAGYYHQFDASDHRKGDKALFWQLPPRPVFSSPILSSPPVGVIRCADCPVSSRCSFFFTRDSAGISIFKEFSSTAAGRVIVHI